MKFLNYINIFFVFVIFKDFQIFTKQIERKIKFYSKENIDSKNYITRNGILIKRPNAKATVLICHGYMCDKYDVSFLHVIFNKYNTMTFDFRAHGEEKENQICTLGRDECYDVLAAVKFIKSDPELKRLPLIIYGFSMGAVATIIAGSINKKLCDAMILDCPFDSSDKILKRSLDKIKINLFGYQMGLPGADILQNYAYNPYAQNLLKKLLKSMANMDSSHIETFVKPVYPEEAIKYIKVPIYLIGCYKDEKVPEEAIMSVYQGAKGIKRLWLCHGRKHFDPIFFQMNKYIKKVNNFINSVLKNKFVNKKNSKIIKE